MGLTVSVNIISDLIQYLVSRGVERPFLLSLVNTTDDYLANPHNRLPCDACDAIWKYAETELGDNCIGLRTGERHSAAALGLLAPLIQSCPDLWTALLKASDYINIVSDVHSIKPEKKDGKLVIVFEPVQEWVEAYPLAYRHIMSSTFIYTINTLSSLAGKQIVPINASLSFSLPENKLPDYERVYGCPVVTEAKLCSITFDGKCVHYPIQSRNVELMQLLEQHIKSVLERQQTKDTFSSKVRQIIIKKYHKEFPDISEVSDMLALSIRNLQRKLKEENTNFLELISDIKKELAEDYLRNKSLSISEISYMLGYAEPAVFTRAYKKWTGLAPEMARSRVLAEL